MADRNIREEIKRSLSSCFFPKPFKELVMATRAVLIMAVSIVDRTRLRHNLWSGL